MEFITHYYGFGNYSFGEDGELDTWEGYDLPKPSREVLIMLEAEYRKIKEERLWRDYELNRADNEINRAQDEEDDVAELVYRDYRKALRAYPTSPSFPNGERPSP